MDTGPADILSRHSVPRHRLTLEDYHRLGKAGILGEDDRVELLEGQLVDMSPIGPRHALVVDLLSQLLVRGVADRAWVRTQNPVVLDDGSEPQPDITLLRNPWHGYPTHHPGPEDVLLLVEVADSSLEFDRSAKLELYARAGIAEFWLVDLTKDQVLVHRRPSGGQYGLVLSFDSSGTLEVEMLPGVTVTIGPLFA